MNNPVAHGAIVLMISLATVGAVVTATDQGQAVAGNVEGGVSSVLRSEQFVPLASTEAGVPIRDGRISRGHLVPDTAATTPVRIRVGAIALEALVIPVGVDENSQLDVPSADKVGWYRYSAIPGESGASVLAAHVDYAGAEGAFFRLGQLGMGDTLEVEMADGASQLYQVAGVYQYDKTDLPAEELFRKDGSPVLQLITCGGTFNPKKHSYEANVVVTAVPVTA
jgi:LPXTG-site transpeptidase (sortase) family protein